MSLLDNIEKLFPSCKNIMIHSVYKYCLRFCWGTQTEDDCLNANKLAVAKCLIDTAKYILSSLCNLVFRGRREGRTFRLQAMSSPKLGNISNQNNISCFTLVCYITTRKPSKCIAHFIYTNYVLLNSSLSMGANPIQSKNKKTFNSGMRESWSI